MDSKVNYGQEIGPNTIKITKKLLRNQNLCKLILFTDKDPLNHADIEDPFGEIYGKNIRNVPLITLEGEEENNTETKLIIIFTQGDVTDNKSNESLLLRIYVYCPYVEWLITGDNLRPYAIMSEIRKSLQDKRINGLGEIKFLDWHIATLTPQVSSHILEFSINDFS